MNYPSILQPNMLRRDNKVYILPPISLKPYIAHYTFAFPANHELPDYLTLIPDASGCLVLTFTGSDFQCCFFGPSTKLITVENQHDNVPLMIFVEFMPGGASQLLHLNQSELLDQLLPLVDISLQLQNDLIDIIYKDLDTPDNINLITQALNRLFLSYLSNAKSYSLTDIIAYIYHNRDIVSVRKLSEESQYSERHFNRLFTQSIGTNTKSFLKLLRVNQAVKAIKNHDMTFTNLAQEIGYYDQAHFIHDFKSVCGVTPSDYKLHLSEFYNEDFKF